MTGPEDTLLRDMTSTGARWCAARSVEIDRWVVGLFREAVGDATAGIALVATGGYGRAELCPQSDIDVMLVHDRRADVAEVAERIWYPIWDTGLKLGHSVFRVPEALSLAGEDLDTATALLSSRHLGGDATLTEQLSAAALEQWRSGAKKWLAEMSERVTTRQRSSGEVAFLLEPDLKDGRGGLRDVHSLRWAELAQPVLTTGDAVQLDDAETVLLEARVELQRLTGRTSNVLHLQEQDAVAEALGDGSADELMARISDAARSITWISDDTWRRIGGFTGRRQRFGRSSRQSQPATDGLTVVDGELRIDTTAPIADPLTAALVVSTEAARHGVAISRTTLADLADASLEIDGTVSWPPARRAAFIDLLAIGAAAVPLIESLDHVGIWVSILPEWSEVQSLPQRNAYHRFTVDRHLLETAANAAMFMDKVDRGDLVLLAALLHDLGKGSSGDHSDVGAGLAATICHRMGLDQVDIDTVCLLVRHHLLLAEVATRRDLDDPTTIERVLKTLGTAERVELLAALTEADSLATGSSAWSPWKAGLVDQLVARAKAVAAGEEVATTDRRFPDDRQMELLAGTEQVIEHTVDSVMVVCSDRPGNFSRVAGTLALHGLDVLEAAAHSADGRALSRFRVSASRGTEIDWDVVISSLRLALAGRLALPARLAERARTYRTRKRTAAVTPTTVVSFDDGASTEATVIDVRAANSIGALYRVTRALAELDLDIRGAKVQSSGELLIDSFFVLDTDGERITDPERRREIELAIRHGLQADL